MTAKRDACISMQADLGYGCTTTVMLAGGWWAECHSPVAPVVLVQYSVQSLLVRRSPGWPEPFRQNQQCCRLRQHIFLLILNTTNRR